ncbi:MAG: hypothetical protein RL114_120, partial [Actinomycetota bacterium]
PPAKALTTERNVDVQISANTNVQELSLGATFRDSVFGLS